VVELALYPIKKGIQARLDKFHLRRGMDLPQWMCNELPLANRAIIDSNEAYKGKADGRLCPSTLCIMETRGWRPAV
jgi:hypothetical protein